MPQKLLQRNGIGGIAHKLRLIDIDANPYHRTLHHCAFELMIEEHSANLFLPHIHIIRPFHTDSFDIRIESLGDCQTSDFRKIELLGSAHILRSKHEGEHEIFSAVTFPRCPHLSVSACLKISRHEPHFLSRCSIHRNHLHCSGHGGVMLANPMRGELGFCWCTTAFAGVFFTGICYEIRRCGRYFARVRIIGRSNWHFETRKRVHQQDFSGESVEGVPTGRRFCSGQFQTVVRYPPKQ